MKPLEKPEAWERSASNLVLMDRVKTAFAYWKIEKRKSWKLEHEYLQKKLIERLQRVGFVY